MFECEIGEIEISTSIDDNIVQTIKIPCRTELLLSNLTGEISEEELINIALDEAPKWLEVKESNPRLHQS